jgi:hypothetical protein
MTAAILTILAALVPFVIWLIRRGINRKEDPIIEHQRRYERIDRDIISRASEKASANAGDDLDELERLERMQKSASGVSGSAGDKPEGR